MPYEYFLFVLPPALLAMLAQSMLKSRYAAACRAPASITGAAAARALLDSAGCQHVRIERIAGTLTDHYDPRAKVLRLSENSYNGRNLAAIGVAAHEAGHALQDAQRYKLMVVRQLAVPLASLGGNTAMILIMVGLAMQAMHLAMLGVAGFGLVALFQIVNLPVEYNASARAREQLEKLGFITSEQAPMVRKMLSAAALTYVAGTLDAVGQFLYFLLTVLGRSQRR